MTIASNVVARHESSVRTAQERVVMARVIATHEFEVRFPKFVALMKSAAWGRGTLPREFYLPEDFKNKPSIKPKGTDLEIWTWQDERSDSRNFGKFYGIAFQGKASKPLWYYSFRDKAGLWKQINESVEYRRKQLEEKAAERQRRKEEVHGLVPGDILYSSWGYDQTNVDFYQVVEATGKKQVIIREVAKKVVKEDSSSEYVVAVPNKFVGPPEKKMAQGSGDRAYVKINSFSSATKWDGKPKYQTGPYSGH